MHSASLCAVGLLSFAFVTGCQAGPRPTMAIGPVATSGWIAIAPTAPGPRRVLSLGFDDVAAIARARLTVRGPGIEAPIVETVPWAVARLGLDAAETSEWAYPLPPASPFRVRVPEGPNRLVVLEGLDAKGHVIATVRGLTPVVAGQTAAVRLDALTDAAGRTLERLLALETPVLASKDATAPLLAFIARATGFVAENNAYRLLDPLRFRSALLATQIHTGAVPLAGLAEAPVSAEMAQSAGATITVRLQDGGLPADSARATLHVPGRVPQAFTGALTLTDVPPGLWSIRLAADADGRAVWGSVTAADVEVAPDVVLSLPAAPAIVPHGATVSTVYDFLPASPLAQATAITALRHPGGVTAFYLADNADACLRALHVAADGTATAAVAAGVADGVPGHRNGPGATARFGRLSAIAAAPDGTLYMTDALANRGCLRRVTLGPGGVTVEVLTTDGRFAADDDPTRRVGFFNPTGLASAPDGTLYVGDERLVEQVAIGSGAAAVVPIAGSLTPGWADGPGGEARFRSAGAIAASDAVYVADAARIRRLEAGHVATVAGSVTGHLDGPAAAAEFRAVGGLALLPGGRLLALDQGVLRLITPDGEVRTIAPAAPYQAWKPRAICVSDGTIYALDEAGVRRLDLDP